MVDPHWTSYVGMVSGVIGIFVASVSLYKTSKIKTLELRLELKRAVLDISSLHEELREILHRAKKSRKSMSAAMGTFKSGAMKLWIEEHSNDTSTWQEMEQKLPNKESTYKSLNSEHLEKKLIEVHEQRSILQSIKDNYLESIKKDEKNGEFLREQAHKRVHNHT